MLAAFATHLRKLRNSRQFWRRTFHQTKVLRAKLHFLTKGVMIWSHKPYKHRAVKWRWHRRWLTPLRRNLYYHGMARRALVVDPLPQGAQATYEFEISTLLRLLFLATVKVQSPAFSATVLRFPNSRSTRIQPFVSAKLRCADSTSLIVRSKRLARKSWPRKMLTSSQP